MYLSLFCFVFILLSNTIFAADSFPVRVGKHQFSVSPYLYDYIEKGEVRLFDLKNIYSVMAKQYKNRDVELVFTNFHETVPNIKFLTPILRSGSDKRVFITTNEKSSFIIDRAYKSSDFERERIVLILSDEQVSKLSFEVTKRADIFIYKSEGQVRDLNLYSSTAVSNALAKLLFLNDSKKKATFLFLLMGKIAETKHIMIEMMEGIRAKKKPIPLINDIIVKLYHLDYPSLPWGEDSVFIAGQYENYMKRLRSTENGEALANAIGLEEYVVEPKRTPSTQISEGKHLMLWQSGQRKFKVTRKSPFDPENADTCEKNF